VDPEFWPLSGQTGSDRNTAADAGAGAGAAPGGGSPWEWEHPHVWMPHIWMPAIKRDRGASREIKTIPFLVLTLVVFITATAMSSDVSNDNTHVLTGTILGTGLLIVGFTLAFLLPSGITFVLFYSALALGLGGSIALAGALAAGVAAFPTRVGMIGGTLTGSYALAAVIQVPVISSLAATIGWVDALRLVGSMLALLAVAIVLLMPAMPRLIRPRPATGAVPFLQLMRRKQVWTGFLLEVTASPLGAYAFVAIATFARGLSLALWVATGTVIAVAAGNALGRIIAGAASDRFGVNRVFLVILALSLLAVILLLVPGNGLTVLLAALAAGIGFGGPVGLLSRLASASVPDAPNTAFGLLFFGYALGVFFGPLLGAAAGGNIQSWVVLGGVAGIGLLMLIIRGMLARSGPERVARG
jgi:predicted MFS family arabinose efflux permease